MDDSSDSSAGDPMSSSSKSSSGSWKDSRTAKSMGAAGKSLSSSGKDEDRLAGEISQRIGAVQYHKGGKVRKTGPAILKRNERVIPAGKRKKAEKKGVVAP